MARLVWSETPKTGFLARGFIHIDINRVIKQALFPAKYLHNHRPMNNTIFIRNISIKMVTCFFFQPSNQYIIYRTLLYETVNQRSMATTLT